MWTEWGWRNPTILPIETIDDETISNIEQLWQKINKLKDRIKALENAMIPEKRKMLKADKCLMRGCRNLELRCKDCGRVINEATFTDVKPKKIKAKPVDDGYNN